MQNPTEIIPGLLFFSYLASARKDKVGFFEDCVLVLQVSGQMSFEAGNHKVTTKRGELLLIRRNQLAELTKHPVDDEFYQTIVIRLKEDLLRQIALEEQLTTTSKYTGPSAILIPGNDFLQGFFQSIMPYVKHPEQHQLSDSLGILKVKEAVQLLLYSMPSLRDFLFDFSEPHKIDLEKFMLTNYHFNVPVEKFAQLTGRSLAGFKRDFQKIFNASPRQWLQEKRLTEARQLIERKQLKPSAIYLDLGFESLSHFSHAFKKKFGKTPTEWAA
ncbi:MAG: AraC family transcriptional regulator [Citrobacter freundii]|nr:MAG: AraC family transcriptional regulator [Citrobacter freundii]